MKTNWGIAVAAGAMALGVLSIGVGAAGVEAASLPEGKVRVAFSGTPSELRDTVPITRSRGRARTIMSVPDSKLGRVRVGDRVEGGAEFQVTINCFERTSRCFGKPYQFTPRVEWRLVLAPSTKVAGGKRAVPLSRWKRGKCSWRPPNRNHHCVYVVRNAGATLDRMPRCGPGSCHVNLVLRAFSRKARPGDKLAIGGDGDDGSIVHNNGRVMATLYRGGPQAPGQLIRKRKLRRRLPIARDGQKSRVVYRARLDHLKAGEQVLVDAKTVAKVGHLPYSVLAQSKLVLSTRRDRQDLNGVRNAVTLGGRIGDTNGFNCTQGRSAFQSPCTVRKLAAFNILKDVEHRSGAPRPLYVLLTTSLRWHHGGAYRKKHTGKLGKGRMRVERFPSERKLHPGE